MGENRPNISELQDTIDQLQNQLDQERRKNKEKTTMMEQSLSETEELAKHLQNTTQALAQERQFAIARAEKERLLSRWVERINSSFDLEEVLAISIQELGQYIKSDRCGVILFDKERVIFNEFSHVLWQRDFDKNKVRENPLIKKVTSASNTVILEGIKEGEFDDDFMAGTKSFLAVPLVISESISGAIYLQQCSKDRAWNKREVDLLETAALPLATAIEKSKLYNQERASTAQEELLNRLTARIRSSLNLGEILSRTVKELGIALHVSRCFVYTENEGVIAEYCKEGAASIAQNTSGLILDKLSDSSSRLDSLVINNIYADQKFESLAQNEQAELASSGAKSALAIPLHAQNVLHGWLVFHNCESERQWKFDEVNFVESVASQVAVAMTQSKIYEKLNSYQGKISRELKQAARVQTALIGGDVFDANLEISVFYKAHSNVSGDFYWIAELSPHNIGVLIGDVSGKGPAAALLTGYLLGEFNAAVSNSPMAWHPEKMINFLCRSILYQNSSSDFYATAWYGVFDLATGELQYCNSGHLNPYLIKDGKVSLLDEEKDSGVPLGLLDPKDLNEHYQRRTLKLDPGDKMVLFTDGVMDQRMPNGEFVPKDWLEKQLLEHQEKSVKDITYELNEKLNDMSGDTPLSDDRLMICLEQNTFDVKEFDVTNQQACDNLIAEILHESTQHGLPEDRALDLKLGLVEALTNAVRYGIKKNPNGKVGLGYKIADGSFKMSLMDPGPGFNWQMYSHVSIEEVGLEDEGGRGIPLLQEIFDKVSWNPTGNQIGLFFYW